MCQGRRIIVRGLIEYERFSWNYANKSLQMHNEKWQAGDDNVKKAVTYKCFSFRFILFFSEYTFKQKCLLKLCAFTWNILLSRFIAHYYWWDLFRIYQLALFIAKSSILFFKANFIFQSPCLTKKVQFWNGVLFQCQARVTFGVN